MQLYIFEDKYYKNLEPITLSRPVYDLICGAKTLKEKTISAFPKLKYSLLCREYLSEIVKQENQNVPVNEFIDETSLFINGRVIAPSFLNEVIPTDSEEEKLYINYDEEIVAAKISSKRIKEIKKNFNGIVDTSLLETLPVEKIEVKVAGYIWDFINLNGEEIKNDFNLEKEKRSAGEYIKGEVSDGVHLINKENIIIEEGAVIKPGTTLDASDGPIFIDKNVIVYPNTFIEGPVYVGENSKVKAGALIYENTSIGHTCKVGGEVEETIMLPYSNKQHAGFIGHSYLGSWINLGADTNCSDLKNNYSTVKIYVNKNTIDSGSQFLGLIMGDHSKTAINTMFNTGTIVGFSSNIFGAGFPDKFIPSFYWGGSEGFSIYDLEKSIETARVVFGRRDVTFTEHYENLFKEIFDLTKEERKND